MYQDERQEGYKGKDAYFGERPGDMVSLNGLSKSYVGDFWPDGDLTVPSAAAALLSRALCLMLIVGRSGAPGRFSVLLSDLDSLWGNIINRILSISYIVGKTSGVFRIPLTG